jgi:enoyl-CoA hydratase/carnithine racemase
LRLGLAHEISAADAIEDAVARVADELLHGAPGAIATLKGAAANYATPSLAAILANQTPHDTKTPEAIEGIASFREKRKPNWYPK